MYNEFSLPYWRNTADVFDLYQHRAHRRDDGMIVMNGTFLPAILPEHCYDFVFVPDEDGEPRMVVPVFEGCRLIDIVAIGEGDVWGCVTGYGMHLGTITDRVYDTPAAWLAGEIGILPLSKPDNAGTIRAR